MRIRTGWLAWLLTAGVTVALAPAAVRAQGYAPADPVLPLPLYSTHPERGGFYIAPEFIFLRQTNPIKSQLIAVRGFIDVDGSIQAAVNILTGQLNEPIIPGTFFGSGAPALNADQVSGPASYQPGWGLTLGWRFDEGSWVEAIQFRWRHLTETKYIAGTSIVPPDFSLGVNLEDSFLFAPVFNFPNEFAGPVSKIGVTGPFTTGTGGSATGAVNIFSTFPSPLTVVTAPGASAQVFTGVTAVATASSAGAIIVPQAPYGVWNGATTMHLWFVQRFDDYDLIGRIPVYQDENCRCYGLVGVRHVAMWERFAWRTISVEQAAPSGQATATVTVTGFTVTPAGPSFTVTGPGATITTTAGAGLIAPAGGTAGPDDTAIYSNVVSNQLYGPMIGGGTEYYLGHGFSLALDVRAGVLLNVVKEVAKYRRGDELIQNKRTKREYTIAPELDATLDLTWFPIEGVELRVGYEVMNFFNTVAAARPVSFDYGNLDPPWEKGVYRFFDGFHAGLALIF